MIRFIKTILKNQTSKNFSALAIVQATNYLFPLITLPYILNIVGTDNYGMVALAQAFFSYQIIITDFSFNLTSSAAIALNRNDQAAVSRIFSETFSIKLALIILMFIVLQLLIFVIPVFQEEKLLFNLGFILVLGQAMLPAWFFQGIEKIQFLTYINLVTKAICLVLVFVLIRDRGDYIYILALNGLGNFLSAFICLVLIITRFKVSYSLPKLISVKKQIQEGLNIFYSSILVNVYINSNIIILSYFVGKDTLGMYGVAEKVIQTIRSVLVVFYQATYPQVLLLKAKGIEALNAYYKKAFYPFLLFIIGGTSICFVFPDFILTFLTGNTNDEMAFYLRLFSVVPFIVALNIPPNQLLLIFHEKKMFFQVIFGGTILNIMLNVCLSYLLSATGTIISIIVTELFITLAYYYAVNAKGIYAKSSK